VTDEVDLPRFLFDAVPGATGWFGIDTPKARPNIGDIWLSDYRKIMRGQSKTS
jgi:hypothetical protein